MKNMILLYENVRNTQIIFLESPQRIPDLHPLLRKAALEFIQTEKGRRFLLADGGISYRHFFSNASDEIFFKYGIRQVDRRIPDLTVHPDSLLLSGQDAARLSSALPHPALSVSETAACLGEMWGIMEAVDGEGLFSEGILGQNLPLLMKWAEEYAANPCCSLAEFFHAKIKRQPFKP